MIPPQNSLNKEEIKEIEKKFNTTIPIKIIFNKFDSRNNLSHEKLDYLRNMQEFKEKLYSSYIRISQDFPNAIENGQTIFDVFKETAAKQDIDLLAKEVFQINNFSKLKKGQ